MSKIHSLWIRWKDRCSTMSSSHYHPVFFNLVVGIGSKHNARLLNWMSKYDRKIHEKRCKKLAIGDVNCKENTWVEMHIGEDNRTDLLILFRQKIKRQQVPSRTVINQLEGTERSRATLDLFSFAIETLIEFD